METTEITGAIGQVSPQLANGGVRLMKLTSAQEQPPIAEKKWPQLKSGDWGLVGQISELATSKSEADPIAVMATAMVFGSAYFGRTRYVEVGDSVHHPRIFATLVLLTHHSQPS